MEPVFRTLEIAATIAIRAAGTAITYQGLQNIPERGGAVIAINHTSYIDFLPAALATHRRHRRMRFMIKAEMTDVRIVAFLITHTGAIPVDRSAGADSYAEAVRQLRAGELVGVYPEATISRSFELKEFKSGAVRMALEARVPIIPSSSGAPTGCGPGPSETAGPQQDTVHRPGGRPVAPGRHAGRTRCASMRAAMTTMLHEVQEQYPHPGGAHWVPRRLGGGAPTPAEAARIEEAELAERARRAAGRH